MVPRGLAEVVVLAIDLPAERERAPSHHARLEPRPLFVPDLSALHADVIGAVHVLPIPVIVPSGITPRRERQPHGIGIGTSIMVSGHENLLREGCRHTCAPHAAQYRNGPDRRRTVNRERPRVPTRRRQTRCPPIGRIVDDRIRVRTRNRDRTRLRFPERGTVVRRDHRRGNHVPPGHKRHVAHDDGLGGDPLPVRRPPAREHGPRTGG